MADLRTVFVVLEDIDTQAGVPLTRALEGDDIADHNAHGALVAKDPDDKFKYLQLTDKDALKVTIDEDYVCLSDDTEHAGNTSYVDLASITLQAEYIYRDVEALVSCFRDSLFQIVWVADAGGTPVETILASGIRAGAGQYNEMVRFECMQFTTGATGDQILKIKGKNTIVASTLNATLSVKEIGAAP